jgi:arylsulfatase
MAFRTIFLTAACLAAFSGAWAEKRPNIILIMADDMGFSDVGCFGGEIHTPNIDALAKGGVKMAQFYNNARCCPTRASLLTGLQPHQAGVGNMTKEEQRDDSGIPPAYIGELSRNTVTIAEALRGAGYATFMAGKWHLGQFDKSLWPCQRGFDRYYGSLYGALNYFKPVPPRLVTYDNETLAEAKSTTDQPFYTTDAFTDYAIHFLKEKKTKQRPFFLYLVYNAPHWPLQAFPEDIAKYRGKYTQGWDVLRQARYDRQKAMGLVDPRWPLSPRPEKVPAWDSLTPEQKDEMDLRMAIYAAQVDRMDQNIGRLVSCLKSTGQFDNTLILFFSDNGACAEGGVFGANEVRDVEKRNAGYFVTYGEAWANLSSTPFRLYKHFGQEGGTHTAFIASWPDGFGSRDEWIREPAQVLDVMPTFLEVASAKYPLERDGHKLPALEGVSFLSALKGEGLKRTKPMFMEHENNAFVRDGDWKLVGIDVAKRDGMNSARWELYNLRDDGTELHDLANSNPQKTAELAAAWQAWANRSDVYPKPAQEN